MQRKQTKIPKTVSHRLRLGTDDIYRTFYLRHLREDDGLVCAEGEEPVYELPEGAVALYADRDDLFYYKVPANNLYQLNGSHRQFSHPPVPKALYSFSMSGGGISRFSFTEEGVYRLNDKGYAEILWQFGATCVAIFKERVFLAKNNSINYTAALAPSDFNSHRHHGGNLLLPSEDGKFIGAVAFRDQLYFFRERGILLLRVLGDDLNFKAIPIRFGGGTIVPETIADCGDCILFFTERGLYSFNGGTCKLQELSLFEQMSVKPAKAVSFAGRYYALCTHRELGSCVYCFEPQTGKAHFIFLNTQLLTAGYGVWHMRNNGAYRLTAQGAPVTGKVRMINEPTDFGLGSGEKLLEAITVEGEGEYEVTANSEYSVPYTVKGKAGGKLCFPAPVRGSKFVLDITSSVPAEVRVKAIVLHFKEIKNDD